MKVIAVLFLSSAALSSLSYADSNWYALAAVGQSKFQASKSDIDRPLTDDGLTVYSSQLDARDTGFKFQVGYQVTPNFAIEGGYVDLGRLHYHADSSDPMLALSGIHLKETASIHAFGFNIDALAALPIGAGFSLFAKAGIIAARVEAKVSVDGFIDSEDSSTNNFKPTFGVGSEYAINRTWNLRIEFERFANLGDKNKTGEGNVDLASIGLTARF